MIQTNLYFPWLLILQIALPVVASIIIFILPKELKRTKATIAIVTTAINLLLAIKLFRSEVNYSVPWLNFGFDFSLRLYPFSAFIMLAVSLFGFLISLYSSLFMKDKAHATQFYAYLLITIAFTLGAVLSDNLFLLLFFWEGLLLVLYGMIAIGDKTAFKPATKAFIIVGVTDLCMMIGIALSAHLTNTLSISKMNIPASGLGALAYLLLVIGAISKAGSMPFHSWIPSAAKAAPLPFMALVPGALEKLLGIYFLTRISFDMFKLREGSFLSVFLMSLGACTILFAVAMALIQKNYKRLLSYHAISQVGYMVLGIGTALPAGVVGAIFHMINNALYKSGLFLTAGSVEKQAGTTNLEELGGLGRKMPITFICFIITAAAISGFPFLNGFFSKELIYDAALERGFIFYFAALLGSFLTAASFLKLGHTVFMGEISQKNKAVKEVAPAMLAPLIILSLFCVFFGLFNFIPLKRIIVPIVEQVQLGEDVSFTFHVNIYLVIASIVTLVLAFINHLFGVKRSQSALHAADHIRNAPVLSYIYDKAEKKFFDPFEIGLKISRFVSKISFRLDRGLNWIYDGFLPVLALRAGALIRKAQGVSYPAYLMWCLVSSVVLILYLVYSL